MQLPGFLGGSSSRPDQPPPLSFGCIAALPAVAPAPDGRRALPPRLLLGGSDTNLRLLSIPFSTPEAAMAAKVKSPSGGAFAASLDGLLSTRGMLGHGAPILAVTPLLPPGRPVGIPSRAVSADQRGSIVLWDVVQKCALLGWDAHGASVYSLSCPLVLELAYRQEETTGVDGSGKSGSDRKDGREPDNAGDDLTSAFVRSAAKDGSIKLWRLPLGPVVALALDEDNARPDGPNISESLKMPGFFL